jgi:hypothetical protein
MKEGEISQETCEMVEEEAKKSVKGKQKECVLIN